jgi:hypothetical protein
MPPVNRQRLLPILCTLLAIAVPAAAQTAIHRCVGTGGRPAFTDQPCATIGATPVLPPAATSARPGGAAADGATAGLLCAKSLADLRTGIAQGFALKSANRIGGLVLWNASGQSATEGMRSIEALIRQPLVSLDGDEAGGIDIATSVPGGGLATRQTHFDVVRDAGCLWLRPRPQPPASP